MYKLFERYTIERITWKTIYKFNIPFKVNLSVYLKSPTGKYKCVNNRVMCLILFKFYNSKHGLFYFK